MCDVFVSYWIIGFVFGEVGLSELLLLLVFVNGIV